MDKNFFYITTTAPYVNSDPHIGFALEIVQADAIARYHNLLGDNVVFGFGTDEHGLKIYRKALENKLSPQEYCDQSLKTWVQLKSKLNLSYTKFVRTTDERHIKAAQEIWRRCLNNDDIYKKTYKSKYCVGCELEKTDSELEKGRCPIHPNLELELIDEENYFFSFSKYQKPLLEYYAAHPSFVIPNHRFNEIKTFVKNGLQDFSISRLKKKMPWGIPILGDPNQVMYVWFDALTFYLTNLGWPENQKDFTDFWGTKATPNAIQVAGKDNLRQQTAIWQAMLMSAGLPNSKQILIHGFITSDGQKMSKSLGNVVNPFDMVEKYGTDAVRYYLLREIPTFDDGDFSERRFKELYNSDLANGLGNLVARVAKLCETDAIDGTGNYIEDHQNLKERLNQGGYTDHWEKFEFNLTLEELWREIKTLDIEINNFAPWTKNKDERSEHLKSYVKRILSLAKELQPFLPETAQKIQAQFSAPKITSQPSLFPRLK